MAFQLPYCTLSPIAAVDMKPSVTRIVVNPKKKFCQLILVVHVGGISHTMKCISVSASSFLNSEGRCTLLVLGCFDGGVRRPGCVVAGQCQNYLLIHLNLEV